MTVIAQDDHLTAGAWAACGPVRSFELTSLNSQRGFSILYIRAVLLMRTVMNRRIVCHAEVQITEQKN